MDIGFRLILNEPFGINIYIYIYMYIICIFHIPAGKGYQLVQEPEFPR
jgi:hypothetical protein